MEWNGMGLGVLSSTEGRGFNREFARPAPNNRNNYITAEAVQT